MFAALPISTFSYVEQFQYNSDNQFDSLLRNLIIRSDVISTHCDPSCSSVGWSVGRSVCLSVRISSKGQGSYTSNAPLGGLVYHTIVAYTFGQIIANIIIDLSKLKKNLERPLDAMRIIDTIDDRQSQG